MEARNNSLNITPSRSNSSDKSPFNSPNKSRRDSLSSSSSRSSSKNTMAMAARVRMFIVGVFVGVMVARPLFLLGGMSTDTAASLEAYMVPVHTYFDPSVQTSSSSSVAVSSSTGTREAEAATADDPSQTQLRASAAAAASTTTNVSMNTNTSSTAVIRDFEAQPRVVIATKIHGPPHIPQLKQSLCLLMAAYNNRPVYDIVVFTTLPVTKIDEMHLKEIVHPAHLTMETDHKTLSQHINDLEPEQKRILYERCNRTYDDPIYWETRACEVGGGACMPLAYSWQSEFRAKHIWKHSALAKYKYMLWYDSDAMATKVWEQDPITVMIRNDLAMFFDHFPQGKTRGQEVQEKIMKAYNSTLCGLRLGREGHLVVKGGDTNCGAVPQIHGFFHITNLDFYRSPENLRWYDILIGDTKFSRKWDDQLAVTVPAAMRAPHRSWEMGANGVKLDVWHNGELDGQRKWKGGGYLKWWKKEAEVTFPEGFGSCQSLVTNPGR
jgi:hypothetical protein